MRRKLGGKPLDRPFQKVETQSCSRISSGRNPAAQQLPTILFSSRRLRASMGVTDLNKAATFGKGRFGKRAESFTIDYGGHSNDSNSNDSGVGCDFQSSESQLSWCSEDSHLGRSSSISNLSAASIPQFPPLSRKRLFEDSTKDKFSANLNLEVNTTPAVGLLDIGVSPGKLLIAEKVQPIEDMRMSPDTTNSPLQLLGNQGTNVGQMLTGIGSHSPNSNSPTSTVSPIPMKRARFSYPPQPPSVGAKIAGLKLRNQNQNGRSLGKRLPPGTAPTLTSALSSLSRDGRCQLQILAQPEEQHRARYQTEGSRGAIKDRKGNGFPSVKLVGYDKPATLQIFIGTDQGKVNPHMFYQACKVTGKSSTPCIEKKIEGTIVIEIEFEPSKEMVISCDCVGILKERNVDVEQRFPFHHASQSRKKSTKCRMIFRTTIINSAGMEETLQISSVPILCTQPPGLPEICKQSLYDCPAKGGLELFVIGKNFLKDTKVVFHEDDEDGRSVWESTAEPLKDYLQQNHLICPVPPYRDQNMMSPAECKVTIVSAGKHSESHRFTYLPNISAAHYGIPASSTCSPSNSSSQSIIPETLTRSLSHGEQLLAMDLQGMDQLTQRDEIPQTISNGPSPTGSGVSLISSHSNIIEPPQIARTTGLQQQIGSVSPPVEPLPPLSFPNSMLPPTTSAQERQVVNELQCILEQSVQQNQHEKAVAEMMSTTTIMSIKPEATFTDVTMGQPSVINVPTSVPLDLQFPTDNVQPVVPVTFTEQGICGPQFSSAAIMGCIGGNGLPQLLTRSGSMEATTDSKLLTELMPNSQPSATPSTNSFIIPGAPSTMSMNNVNPDSLGMASTAVVTASQMAVTNCMGQGLIKVEPQQPATTANVCMTMNNIVVPSQPTPIITPNVTVNPANYMGGELQPHQGNFANALSQLSDNELINYINPSCFEQNLI